MVELHATRYIYTNYQIMLLHFLFECKDGPPPPHLHADTYNTSDSIDHISLSLLEQYHCCLCPLPPNYGLPILLPCRKWMSAIVRLSSSWMEVYCFGTEITCETSHDIINFITEWAGRSYSLLCLVI